MSYWYSVNSGHWYCLAYHEEEILSMLLLMNYTYKYMSWICVNRPFNHLSLWNDLTRSVTWVSIIRSCDGCLSRLTQWCRTSDPDGQNLLSISNSRDRFFFMRTIQFPLLLITFDGGKPWTKYELLWMALCCWPHNWCNKQSRTTGAGYSVARTCYGCSRCGVRGFPIILPLSGSSLHIIIVTWMNAVLNDKPTSRK